MYRINNKGFTLVELLATIVILGVIMTIAVPSTLGALNDSRNREYVEDAKKFVALAEYTIRSKGEVSRYLENPNDCIIISLRYLDNSEFSKAPYTGKPYDLDRSYVIVKLGTDYEYVVTLLEKIDEGSYKGPQRVPLQHIYDTKPKAFIQIGNFSKAQDATVTSTLCNLTHRFVTEQ